MPTAQDQISDSVTQVNTKVLGDAPAMAIGNLFIATSQALSNAAHNATNNQQQTSVTAQAATTQAVVTMLSLDTAATGAATGAGLGSGPKVLAAVVTPEAIPNPAQAQQLADAAFEAARNATDPMLSLVLLNAGALAIYDAVQHLARTAIIGETATALALSHALTTPNDAHWRAAAAEAERSITAAADHLGRVCHLAIGLQRDARGLKIGNSDVPDNMLS
jgi:hypothetical protein